MKHDTEHILHQQRGLKTRFDGRYLSWPQLALLPFMTSSKAHLLNGVQAMPQIIAKASTKLGQPSFIYVPQVRDPITICCSQGQE